MTTEEPVLTGQPQPATQQTRDEVTLSWHGPDGVDESWSAADEILTVAGLAGHHAPPVSVTRDPLADAGTLLRDTHTDERIITVPLHVAGTDPTDFRQRWRRLATSLLATHRIGPGQLRFLYPDGTWREIAVTYLDGLQGEDSPGAGVVWHTAVVQVLAPDPHFAGPATTALRFAYTEPRQFLNPFLTVSPDRVLGTQMIDVEGDATTWPTWTVTGPAASFTATRDDGASFSYTVSIAPGDVLRVCTDPRSMEVTLHAAVLDAGGGYIYPEPPVNALGSLNWPGADLWPLFPGRREVTVSAPAAGPGTEVVLSYRPRYLTA